MEDSQEIDDNYVSPGSSGKRIHFSINDTDPPDPFSHLSSDSSYIPVRIERPVVHQLDLYSKYKDVDSNHGTVKSYKLEQNHNWQTWTLEFTCTFFKQSLKRRVVRVWIKMPAG